MRITVNQFLSHVYSTLSRTCTELHSQLSSISAHR